VFVLVAVQGQCVVVPHVVVTPSNSLFVVVVHARSLCLFIVVTRPLLRQIENLQSTFAAQASSYERVEKNLTDRLCKHILFTRTRRCN